MAHKTMPACDSALTQRPEPPHLVGLLHQRRGHSGIDLRGGEPLVPHLLLDHGQGHAAHQGRDHIAVPEDMGGDLLAGELLSGRDLLDPGRFCQAVYGPQGRLGAQVAVAPAGEEPLLAGLDALPDGLHGGLARPGSPEMAGPS
jgi:hypothetical protein